MEPNRPRGHFARVNLLIGTGHFLSHFYMLCLPPLFIVWQREFRVSYAVLGLSAALMSAITAVLQTPVGFLVDRYGARRFLVGGALIMGLGIALMGVATSYWQIVLLAALSGVGNSVIHPADYSILAGSIEKERMGRAFSLHTFSGNLGFTAGPPVMTALILGLGWRESLVLIGGVGVLAAGAIFLQSGILAEGVHRKAHAGPAISGRQLLMTRPMLMFFAFFLAGAMANAGLQSWLITVLHTVHGMDLAVAATVLTIYMAGATSGVLVGGWLSDFRKDQLPAIVVVLTIVAAALIVLAGILPIAALSGAVVMGLAGLAIGTSRTPRDMMVKDAAPPGQVGKVFGFVSSGLPLGSALTPVPFGFLIDRGHPELVLLLVAALLVGSLVCMSVARGAARTLVVAAE
jgi:FSR family fosmidomycin resistance protein-like MFS transporter